MAIKRTFNGATIIKPGAYTKIVVENLTGFPLQPTGTVGIVGEAIGGEPHVLDILSKEGIQDAKARYKSGPIADALELLANPSKDPRIPNGASKIVVYKTNNSTQSAKSLMNMDSSPVAALNLVSKNYGLDENQISVLVEQGALADRHATIEGSIAGPFVLAGGETLKVLAKGTLYTYTGTLSGPAITATALAADMNNGANWAPSKPVVASLVTGTQQIQIVLDPTVVSDAEYQEGWMKIDATSTIDTIIGMSGEDRGRLGSRILTFNKNTFEESTLDLGGQDQILVKYVGAGTAAVLNLKWISSELRLQTTCTGASGDNLDILIKNAEGRVFHTMKTLSDFINQHAAYEASCPAANPAENADHLDYYDSLSIKDVEAGLTKDMFAIADYISTFMTLASASRIDNVYHGLATFANPVFFAGGSDGSSTNTDFANGLEAFKEERISIVVPLISADAGPLTIASINQLALNHALWGWSTIGKSERHVFISFLGSKDDLKDAAKDINSGYASIVGQDVRVLNKDNELTWKDPWAYACILAGMRAGAEVGEPLTAKLINVNDMRVRDGSWQPRKDYAEMIEAGVTFAEPLDTGGFKNVVGNTTYGVDPSFVWNRESVVQAAGYVAYDLRFNLELTFTGTKAKTGTAEAIANFIKNRMSAYLAADIIVGDDLNEKLGYRNLSVSLQGNTAIVNVSITPVQGVDFILPTIYLADISQSA